MNEDRSVVSRFSVSSLNQTNMKIKKGEKYKKSIYSRISQHVTERVADRFEPVLSALSGVQ